MVIEKADFGVFLSIVKELGIRPMVREVETTIHGSKTILYEVIDLDRITEYVIRKEMEEKLK